MVGCLSAFSGSTKTAQFIRWNWQWLVVCLLSVGVQRLPSLLGGTAGGWLSVCFQWLVVCLLSVVGCLSAFSGSTKTAQFIRWNCRWLVVCLLSVVVCLLSVGVQRLPNLLGGTGRWAILM